MRSLKLALALGFLLWLVPFAVSIGLSSVRASDRTLFETLMPIVITLAVVVSTYAYFRGVRAEFLKEGAAIGAAWLAMSLLLDAPMFAWGPMAMGVADYIKDIGLTYLVYPIVTVGTGYLLEKRPIS